MLNQITLKPIFSDINPNLKTVSVIIVTQILNDGIVVAETNDRRAFVPGEIDQLKEYIGANEGPELDYVQAIWTQQIIDEYNNK